MTPTNELRYVKRSRSTPLASGVSKTFPVLVLQQKWVGLTTIEEWRDVPVVE